ncbi:AAA family ATPase [Iamia sp. SCSIO 61187]|uniref:BTAD domain-containing putative transcriptional regulator n=1 Tax=Iamia sp. SCSIO 61187 TaxID=2722752 RepID=UPI001C6315FB|nr:BTAD domain-containing putative transcriptional regulator [Iamia sp. SCSIO 61187]QYG95238.1 AAA family ATPase [Iamia sp. SCSIO 61187]
MGGPPITVRLLGPVEVDVAGEPLGLRARLPRNLLVALALQPGRVVGTDALVTALWGDTPPDSALGTLQSYVSTLRRALGDRERDQPVLDRRGDGYVLVVPPDAVDTVRFEQMVAEARRADPAAAHDLLADALALWRGPALADVASEPFARAAAARLDELRVGAEEERIDAGLALGRHAELVPEIEALVAAHPLREGLTAKLVVALYRSGRQADALRAFERTRTALLEELGISPSAELAALEGAVLRQELDAAPPPQAPPTPVPTRPPTAAIEPVDLPTAVATTRRADSPFVGRESELDRLEVAWADRDRGRRVLAVSGDAGIGKTRLVAEVAARVHRRGGIVLWGACTADTASAYRPFVEALRPLGRRAAGTGPAGPGAAALARLLPEVVPAGEPVPTGGTGDDRGPLFDAVTDLLARTTEGTPTLVVIDDLQWADPASCALLVHLARATELAHVRLAVTYRTAETTLPHPSARALADLRRLRLVEQLPLAGLDDAATAALVAGLAGDRRDELDDDLHERTEGNPFFVEELVAHRLSSTAPADRLPVAVVDVVETRLADLDPEHRRILASAAVLGRSFPTDLLATILDREVPDLLDAIDAAVEAHLVVEDAPPVGRFAFAHALIRDGLLEGMTALRRGHLHLAAADAIAALGPPDDLLAERAHHLVAAGDLAETVCTVLALHAAARRALAVAAYDEAELDCRLALDRVDLAAASPEATDVLLTLAEVRTALGDAEGARQVYRWAADAARAQGDGARLGLAATGLGAGSGVGVPMDLQVVDHERVEWLETALALLDGVDEPATDGPAAGVAPAALRTRFLAHLAVAVYDDDIERAVTLSKQAVAASEELADPTYRSAALIARRMALWCPEADIDERVAVGAAAVREADAGGELLYRIVARLAHLSDLMEAAALDRYDAVLAEADDLCRPLHQARWDWLCDMSGASGLLLTGRYAEADEVLAATIARVGEAHGTMPLYVEMSSRIVLERDLGLLERSVARLRPVEGIAPRPIYDAAAGFSRVMSGDPEGAAACLRPHAEVGLADVPRDHLWAMTVGWYGETAHMLGDAPTAALVADLLAGREERMLCMGGLVAAGLVGRVRGLVLATAGDLDAAVAVLDRALDGHRRLGLRPWVARSALELARVLRWRGDTADEARAVALTAEGEGIAASLGMASPPEPIRPDGLGQ